VSLTEYTEENIQLLREVEHIRLRPQMYLGDIGRAGYHTLLFGPLISAADELRSGFGDWIGFTLNLDGSFKIADNGRGIPVRPEQATGLPIVVGEMTVCPTGKWHQEKPYRGFTGLFGLGATLTALSEWCAVETICGGERYHVEFERGYQTEKLRHLGPANGATGLRISFKPDPVIFGDHTFDLRTILHRLCELAFLNPGVRFTFTDDRTGCTDTFHFPEGLSAFVKHLTTCEEVLHEPIRFVEKVGAIGVEVAFQYQRETLGVELGYSNGYLARNGGTHIVGFRRGLREAFRAFAKAHNCWPAELPVMPEDIREGITVVVNIDHPAPEYEGATRSGLSNADVEPAVAQIVREGLSEYLKQNPDLGKRLCERIANNAKARIAEKEARNRLRAARASVGLSETGT